MIRRLAILLAGFLLDLMLGDPLWLPHPVQAMGLAINRLEPFTRRRFLNTPRGQRLAGVTMAVLVVAISVAVAWGMIRVTTRIHPILGCVSEVIICYQMLATRSLRVESMKVYHALNNGTLEDGRKAVSMIVGRDTKCLSEGEVIAAAVETVAENASDGILAPMLWMAVGGPLAGVFYKAVNTMDSMVGYKNEKYQYFGTGAARLDDLVNWIPARISGVLMCMVACLPIGICKELNGLAAWRIFFRDRQNHASPNSAQTEAACAGALGVQLGGTHLYFGKPVVKPTIGEDIRPLEREDIVRVNGLVLVTAVVAMVLFDVLPCVGALLSRG